MHATAERQRGAAGTGGTHTRSSFAQRAPAALTFVPGGHDGAVKARADAAVNGHQEAGVIEDLEQVLLRDLAASSFQLRSERGAAVHAVRV